MSVVDTYKPSSIRLGYAAGAVLSVLESYIEGKKLELTDNEVLQIDRAREFLDSALKGYEIDKGPCFIFGGEEGIRARSDLHLVFNIFSTNYQEPPKNPSELERELNTYQSSLEKLKNQTPLKTDEELASARKMNYFLKKLLDWSDVEAYNGNH